MPPSSFGARAYGVSANGAVPVGASLLSAGWRATRWVAGSPELLPALAGETEGRALDASRKGAIVVGYSNRPTSIYTATIWDADQGMRPLQDVLEDDYGFDLTGWTLQQAEAISDDGNVIVGRGINPDGRERAFRVVLAEPGTTACSNGIDDDGDGRVDFALDPGCTGLPDDDEQSPSLVCDDGLDNDGDGLVDFPADPGCRNGQSPREDPQCDDDVDNDSDGLVDAADPQCTAAWKDRERACGLGAELALLAPILGRLARRQRRAG